MRFPTLNIEEVKKMNVLWSSINWCNSQNWKYDEIEYTINLENYCFSFVEFWWHNSHMPCVVLCLQLDNLTNYIEEYFFFSFRTHDENSRKIMVSQHFNGKSVHSAKHWLLTIEFTVKPQTIFVKFHPDCNSIELKIIEWKMKEN